MATTSSITVLLKSYASRAKNALVSYNDFCDYLRRYAEAHVEAQPALAVYLPNPAPALQQELDRLAATKQVLLLNEGATNSIVVIAFYIDLFAERYKEILKNPAVPFPTTQEIPRQIPAEIVTRIPAKDLIYKLLVAPAPEQNTLYGVMQPGNGPTLLLPSSISIMAFIETCVSKILLMLQKEEQHDYFLKKITISNPGKEMAAKNFFTKFTKSLQDAMQILKESSTNFYLWNQLCFFIRRDLEKVKDFTAEDISLMQSVYVAELVSAFYKDKTQENENRQQAFAALEQQLNKPPYYFTFDDISKFNDAKGFPLLGQYSEDDLKKFLQAKATEAAPNELPQLLAFKTEMDKRYFIFKAKVLPLIMRLCTDARETVRESIRAHWTTVLKRFDTLPEMKDNAAFERRLEKEVQLHTPILYALLNASFLPLIHQEIGQRAPSTQVSLLHDGRLIPYSEILLMNRAEMYTDARILLPFWYTTPVISWFARLFFQPSKDKLAKEHKTTTEKYREREAEQRRRDKETAAANKNHTVSHKVAVRESARNVESELVPASSTLDRELESYLRQWNHLLGKTSSENLTKDVNSLIRDYVRRVLKTIKSNGVTRDRIQSLAETLVKMPSLQKISDHDALLMYTQLYMIKLIKNMPM